jgi:hypothetical protein
MSEHNLDPRIQRKDDTYESYHARNSPPPKYEHPIFGANDPNSLWGPKVKFLFFSFLFLAAFIVELRYIMVGFALPLMCGLVVYKALGGTGQMIGDGDESDHN